MKIDVLDHGYVRLVDTLGNDLSVVNAARVSYDKESEEFSEKDAKLLNFLLREGHLSPLRHAALTFEDYAPLMDARQHWKYAVGSTFVDDQIGWNESSRRYVTEDEVYYKPKAGEWRRKPENSKQGSGGTYDVGPLDLDKGDRWDADAYYWALHRHTLRGQDLYEKALEDGIAPEQARLFLSANALYVRYRWTVSLAAVIHFIKERLGHGAQYEIMEYAKAIARIVEEQFPMVYAAAIDN